MLLPESKVDVPRARRPRGAPDAPGGDVGAAEVDADVGPQVPAQAAHVAPVQDAVPHGAEQPLEVGPPEVGPRPQLGQGVLVGAGGVEHDVGLGVGVHLLGQVGVDAQELGALGLALGGGLGRLLLERGEQGLEPLEGAGVLCDPDELDAAQARGRVRAGAHVPDVLEDGGPGRHADAGADEHRDLVVEDVLGRRAVGPVDADLGHLLPGLQRHLVHGVGVDGVVLLGLRGPGAEGVAHGSGPVADLAHVDGDVGVEGAGGDGEGVPLLARDGGDVDEEPLAGLVAHAGLGELQLDGVAGVADDLDDLGLAAGADLAVEALDQVDAAAPQLPAPALVADAVIPEVRARERREVADRVPHEAVRGVGVESEQEGDEEVVRVPEGLEGLLPDLRVGGGVHEQHAEEHDVAGDATRLGVVDVEGDLRPDLVLLDVEEVDVVRRDVHDGEYEESVGDLAMKPLRFVEGQKSNLRPYPSEQVPAHGKDYEEAVEGQDEACASRHPYGKGEGVQSSKLEVGFLEKPSQSKKADVTAPEDEVENQPPARELPLHELCYSVHV